MTTSNSYAASHRRPFHPLAVASILLATTEAAAQSVAFENSRHDFPKRALAVTTGDLDLDGRAEAITTNASGDLSIARFDADLRLLSTVHLPLCADLLPARLADFDSDGDLDGFAACRSSTTAFFLRNDGAGMLTTNSVALSGIPSGFDLGDLDLDGDVDVVVGRAIQGLDAISMLRNDGAGAFTVVLPGASNFAVNDLAIGDLTGDGRPDVICSRPSTTLLMFYVLRGNGAGGLVYDPALSSTLDGFTAERLTLADADDDTDLDAWFGSADDSKLGFAKNDGTGRMATPVSLFSNADGYHIADADGDGRIDASRFGSFGGTIHRNFGNAKFTPIDEFASRGRGALGDFDDDGRFDVVSVTDHDSDNTIGVTRRGALGRFHGGYALGLPITNAFPVGRADFDSDGDLDSLFKATIPSESSKRLVLARNDGPVSGGWLEIAVAQTGVAGFLAPGELIADIDSDGKEDVVEWENSSTLFTAKGLGDGTFAGFVAQSYGQAATYVGDACAGDADLDGDLDFAVLVGSAGGSIARVLVLDNDGTGSFGFVPNTIYPSAGATHGGGLAGADLNLDGALDFVATTHQAAPQITQLTPLLSTGPMAWTEQPSHAIGTVTAWSVALHDVDGDASLDAVVTVTPFAWATMNPFALEFFRGLGGGNFASVPISMTGTSGATGRPDFTDLDGDGDVDLVASSPIDGLFDVRTQIAPFSFTSVGRYAAAREAGGGVLDVDGDGRGDLVSYGGLVTPRLQTPAPCPHILVEFGQGCSAANQLPILLRGDGCTEGGDSIHLSLDGAAVGAPALLLLGDERTNLPLGGGCSLFLKSVLGLPLPFVFGPPHGWTDSSTSGSFGLIAQVPLGIPANSSVFLQAFSAAMAPGGVPLAASNGLRIVFR